MKFRNENINEHGYIYGKWMTAPNTWTITFGNVYCYLLIGEEKAILFDTAYGAGNLRKFVEEITDKPVMVVNSHGHFDHTGGNAWWSEVWAGPGAEEVCKEAFSPEMEAEMKKKTYPDYTVHTVHEGDVFDLGGRELEVIEIPAHHESSIALLDRTNRNLYTGDEMEAGQVLLFVRHKMIPTKEIVAAHLANMKKLKAREAEFDMIYPAHNGPQLYKDYIDDFIALSESILNGTATIMPDTAGFGMGPDMNGSPFAGSVKLERAQYGKASFVYARDF